ncbi:DUF6069 family protein [Deinococcus aquatilis]|uniref:DUF6069 family protein n=1 Tax=Deinococcus aquatilis TaxID=519440 RepID=UPI00038270C6|nr:DUF6069 family protein [Deinococcus aquatilis]
MTPTTVSMPARPFRTTALIFRSALLAGGASALINMSMYGLFQETFSTLLVGQPGQEALFWPGAIVLFSLVGALGGGLVFAVMRRFLRRSERAFGWVAGLVLLASLAMLLGVRNGSWDVVLLLALMHVVVCLWVLRLVPGREEQHHRD